ncbi:ABC transporter permease [Telluribacter sp.]|jgi:putative ABC transport system permease protein|uniref:ABC transporter permease n=1 Tax=Telluribacter sp. TaxID=1978767 RepID=UPI002E11C0B5|nr:ABC transporter permease [Telluribacter sp.]
MWKKTLISFSSAIQNIRARFFHTVLSVLGIVIGVASLVGILSLIDGMEQYANEQINKTTSLKAVFIVAKPDKVVNDVRVQKDTIPRLTYTQMGQLHASFTLPSEKYMITNQGMEVSMPGDTHRIGTVVSGSLPGLEPNHKLLHGTHFTDADLTSLRRVAVVNETFARKAGTGAASGLIGKKVRVRDQELTIIGVLESDSTRRAQVYFPISLLSEAEIRANRVDYGLEAKNVEDVPALKEQTEAWLQKNMPNGKEDFQVMTNDFRVKQAAQGFLLFRVIMGLIVGISVVVGGIGVMNVLLISVSERTSEIGVRKAVGAKKRDILLQFLSESVTISTFGSLLGLIMGVLGTMAVIPIVKALTKVPFQAAYTWNTFLVISVIAVVVGVVFGTYPALRAARLDPVEAIRRE